MAVIALIRTSTEAQEVESQEKELKQFIIDDDISEDNIIVVGGAGASAIKVDEAYQQNMNEVYRLIDEGNITAVYAWAVDRIGRNEEVLMAFKNRLLKNGVNIIIKNPSLRLIDEDGSVNSGIEIAFTLFATIAKQEMENKKARFKRAKKRNTEQGKYNGGRIHYGYTVDKDGKIVIDTEEAEVIRLLYDLYSTGDYSIATIKDELNSRGYKIRGKSVSDHFISNMLHTTAFIGYTEFKGAKRSYDRIISDETYNKVQQVMMNNFKGDITKKTKHVYLASKLIICPECGRHWFATNRSYTCIGHRKYGCSNGESISVEWVDVAAWHVAKSCEMEYIYNFTADKAEEARNQIEINNQKIRTIQDKINKVDARKQRINNLYIMGEISGEEQKKHSAKLKSDIAEYQKQIVSLEEDNMKLNDVATFDPEGTLIRLGRLPISGVYENAEEAYKICHKHIKNITIENYEYKNKVQKLITITTVMGVVKRFLYVPKSKVKNHGRIIKLFVENDGEFSPLIADKDFVPCE